MTDTADTRRILELLAQGKVSIDEADELLRAVRAAAPADPPPVVQATAPSAGDASTPSPRWLRMTVDKAAADGRRRQVNIRVPMALVRSGVKVGSAMQHLASDDVVRRLRAKGIDLAGLSTLDLSEFEHLIRDLGETTIDVDDGRARIRLSSE